MELEARREHVRQNVACMLTLHASYSFVVHDGIFYNMHLELSTSLYANCNSYTYRQKGMNCIVPKMVKYKNLQTYSYLRTAFCTN